VRSWTDATTTSSRRRKTTPPCKARELGHCTPLTRRKTEPRNSGWRSGTSRSRIGSPCVSDRHSLLELIRPLRRTSGLHIKFFVDYTVALAKNDKPGQAKAVANLTRYTKEHGAFLAKATGLPKLAVQNDLLGHVLKLKN